MYRAIVNKQMNNEQREALFFTNFTDVHTSNCTYVLRNRELQVLLAKLNQRLGELIYIYIYIIQMKKNINCLSV